MAEWFSIEVFELQLPDEFAWERLRESPAVRAALVAERPLLALR